MVNFSPLHLTLPNFSRRKKKKHTLRADNVKQFPLRLPGKEVVSSVTFISPHCAFTTGRCGEFPPSPPHPCLFHILTPMSNTGHSLFIRKPLHQSYLHLASFPLVSLINFHLLCRTMPISACGDVLGQLIMTDTVLLLFRKGSCHIRHIATTNSCLYHWRVWWISAFFIEPWPYQQGFTAIAYWLIALFSSCVNWDDKRTANFICLAKERIILNWCKSCQIIILYKWQFYMTFQCDFLSFKWREKVI